MARPQPRGINLAKQWISIRSALPGAAGDMRHGELDCRLPIQPNPASAMYTVRLRYRHGQRPKATVVDPPLVLHSDAKSLPHVYPGNELCLYYPGEWRHDMLLGTTILPWISEWLVHYELWLVTGKWTGGGHMPR